MAVKTVSSVRMVFSGEILLVMLQYAFKYEFSVHVDLWDGQRGHPCSLTVIVGHATFVWNKASGTAFAAADPQILTCCISS